MNRIKALVKKSKFLYMIYYLIMSLIVNVMKLFVRTDFNLILFVCYGGLHYADSPKVIYEAMLHDERFANYKLLWAFVNPEKFDVSEKIKIDTLKYFKYALKARCWITNVMVERALNFKGKNTFYFYTGHGTPLKLAGQDIKNNKSSFTSLNKFRYDFCISQSQFDKDLIAHIFNIAPENIAISGVPRNDILATFSELDRTAIRAKLSIPNNKKAILYAPTFRDIKGEKKELFDINIDKWKDMLGDKFVLLYRSHPNISSSIKNGNEFFIDVTKYPTVEELMIASDILISDYSSIIYDYSIMHKPIFLYTYDYDDYFHSRGLYFDIRNELPFAESENELLEKIYTGYNDYNFEQLLNFQKHYVSEYGNATDNCLDIINSHINI